MDSSDRLAIVDYVFHLTPLSIYSASRRKIKWPTNPAWGLFTSGIVRFFSPKSQMSTKLSLLSRHCSPKCTAPYHPTRNILLHLDRHLRLLLPPGFVVGNPWLWLLWPVVRAQFNMGLTRLDFPLRGSAPGGRPLPLDHGVEVLPRVSKSYMLRDLHLCVLCVGELSSALLFHTMQTMILCFSHVFLFYTRHSRSCVAGCRMVEARQWDIPISAVVYLAADPKHGKVCVATCSVIISQQHRWVSVRQETCVVQSCWLRASTNQTVPDHVRWL
jgi:hypothetical protein